MVTAADLRYVEGPPKSVDEVDLFARGSQEHWYEAYQLLREQSPVHKIPGGGVTPGTDAYIITKYEDISRIIRDPETFPPSNLRMSTPESEKLFREQGMGTAYDARSSLRPNLEEHKKHRIQLTDPWVGAAGAERNTAVIRKAVNELMDRWIDKGEVEFVREFAQPLPQIVITTILGFPLEDMPQLKAWEEAQVRRFVWGIGHKDELPPDEDLENAKALVAFQHYIRGHVQDRRQHPADDMITFLTKVQFNGRSLTDSEVVSVAMGMHIGGNETTQFALTSEALLLCQNPGVWRELKVDRSKVRFFVEESLRLLAPTQGSSSRITARDVEIRGVTIPKGSLLHVRYGSGNRDEDAFPGADRIDLGRTNPGRHLTFAQGPRSCPGAGLSRLEQNIAVNVMLDRLESVELAPGKNEFKHIPGRMLGLIDLHLRFRKA